MAQLKTLYRQIAELHEKYLQLSRGQGDYLWKIFESELAEATFNSNAIENSTLTLEETESIVLHGVVKNLEMREVLEAKNLAELSRFLMNESLVLSEEILLKAHEILLKHINDKYAGRFRKKGENVRIATRVAPLSEKVPKLMNDLFVQYETISGIPSLEKIALFHLNFELIHPFCDGNGRLGRALLNFQLHKLHLPPIIIRNKEKKKYYSSFLEYKKVGKTKILTEMIGKSLLESFHKRIAYLEAKKIVALAEWVRRKKLSPQATINAAKRQSIPAFRERGVWKIGQ